MAFGSDERAGQHADCPITGAELPKLVCQIIDHLLIRGVAELSQHRSEAFRRKQIPRGPGCQAAPGKEQTASGADVVTGFRQEHGVAQGGLVLDSARLFHRCRGRRKRQALPPGTGPALVPAHDLIEEADGGAGGQRDVLKVFFCKGLRVGNGTPQPGRYGRDGVDESGAGDRGVSSQ